MAVKEIIFYFSVYGHLVPIILGAYLFKKLDNYLKLLFFIVVFHQLFEGFSLIFIELYQSNLILVPFYNLIDLTAFVVLIFMRFNIKRKILTNLLFILGYIICLLFDEYLLSQSKIQLHAFSGIYTCLVLIILVLFLFYQFLLHIAIEGITTKPDFWIGSGILFYSAFSILFYLFFQHFIKFDINYLTLSISIRAIGIIIANALFSMAFLVVKYQKN